MKTRIQLLSIFVIMLFGISMQAQDGLSINLKEAHAIGDELHLDFLLENKAADAMVSISFRDIKLYDAQGNVYNAKRVVFAQKLITYGGVEQQCIQGIPMKLKLVFKGAPSKLLLVKSLMFKLNRKSDNRDFPVKLNNVIIPTSPNKLVNKALLDSFFLEVAPKVFARLTALKRNQNEVLIEFVILNTGSDRTMDFSFRDTRIIDNLGNSIKVVEMNFAGKIATYGAVSANMPQAIPMKLSYKFKLIDSNAKEIKIFEFTSSGVKFQIRDLPLNGFIVH